MGNLVKTPFSAVGATLEVFDQLGVTPAHLARVRKDRVYAAKVASAFREVLDSTAQSLVTTFSSPVTYIQPSFADLKRAFDWVDGYYAKADFQPIERCQGVSHETREVGFEYVNMGRDASTEEVLEEMDRLNLRPALYEELLSFGAKNPDEQRKFPVVALGSVCRRSNGILYVAYLYGGDSERGLGLSGVGSKWYGGCRFLAVRK